MRRNGGRVWSERGGEGIIGRLMKKRMRLIANPWPGLRDESETPSGRGSEMRLGKRLQKLPILFGIFVNYGYSRR